VISLEKNIIRFIIKNIYIMKYICKFCNYEACDKTHFDRHENTKKHKQNVHQNIKNKYTKICTSDELSKKVRLMCKFCNKEFKYKSGLSRHQNKRCKLKDNNSITKNNELKEKNRKLIEIIHNQKKIAKDSLNAMICIINCYQKVLSNSLPKDENQIKYLIYENKGETKTNESIEDIIIFHNKDDTLINVLTELIVKEYAKNNPKKQLSILSSDVSKLSFILRDVMDKINKSEIIMDEKGLYITETIINPIIDVIDNKLTKFINKTRKITTKLVIREGDEDKMRDLVFKMRDVNLALVGIKYRTIHKRLLLQLAPYFNLHINGNHLNRISNISDI